MQPERDGGDGCGAGGTQRGQLGTRLGDLESGVGIGAGQSARGRETARKHRGSPGLRPREEGRGRTRGLALQCVLPGSERGRPDSRGSLVPRFGVTAFTDSGTLGDSTNPPPVRAPAAWRHSASALSVPPCGRGKPVRTPELPFLNSASWKEEKKKERPPLVQGGA